MGAWRCGIRIEIPVGDGGQSRSTGGGDDAEDTCVVRLVGEIDGYRIEDDASRSSAAITSSTSEKRGSDEVAVLLLHPHPALGGGVRNNVLDGIRTAFAERARGGSLSPRIRLVAAFNARGVGGSSGRVALRGGRDAEDIVDVCRSIQRQMVPSISRIVLVGYSWGACCACTAVSSLPNLVVGFVAISPPLGALAAMSLGSIAHWRLLARRDPKVAILVLHGQNDSFTGEAALRRHVDALHATQEGGGPDLGPEKKVCIALHDTADHFWAGHEPWIASRMLAWLETELASRDM